MEIFSVMGITLLWIFIIILFLIFILFLFSLPKIRVILRYDGEFSASIKFLFLKFQIAGEKKKIKETPEKKKKKENKKQQDKKKKSSVLQGITIGDYIEIIKILFKNFIFKIKIENLFLDAKIACEDAAKTAVLYGKISAAAYPITAFLNEKETLEKAEINIYADFLEEKPEYKSKIIFYTRLISLLYTAILTIKYLLTRESKPKK